MKRTEEGQEGESVREGKRSGGGGGGGRGGGGGGRGVGGSRSFVLFCLRNCLSSNQKGLCGNV